MSESKALADQKVERRRAPRLRRSFVLGAACLSLLPLLALRWNPALPQDPETTLGESFDEGRIGKGGSLFLALGGLGLDRAERLRIDSSLYKLVDARRIRPTDRWEVRRDAEGVVLNIKYWTDGQRYVWLRRQDDGSYKTSRVELPLTERIVSAGGRIETSLWEAMVDQKIPADVIMRFTDLFSWQVDFLTEPRPGDTFKVVWKRRENAHMKTDGDVLYAQYEGKVAGPRTALLFGDAYFDLDGESLQKQFLRAPLNYRRISSYFTKKRYHPVLRYYRPHHGIDYAAAHGTPVVAIGSGRVTFAGWKGGNGKLIKVQHNATYESSYGHLSRYAPGIQPGARVKQGDVIGYVGSTGISTGPHLHFGFEQNNRPINFFSLKIPPGSKVPASKMAAFREFKVQALAELARVGSGSPLAAGFSPSGGESSK